MGAHDAKLRAIADSQFGGGATVWAPASWVIGLSLTKPNDDGTGFVEPPSAAGYARVPVVNNATNWPAAVTVDGETRKANGNKITFPNPTAAWGLCGYWLAFPSLAAIVPDFSNPLDAAISPKQGNTTVEIDVGQLYLIWRGRPAA